MDSDTRPALDEGLEEEYNSFPFVKWRKHVKKTFKKLNGWLVNPRFDDGSYPTLVTSFRGHLGGVVSLDLAELPKKLLIISASGDQSVRLWSVQGDFLGIFGVKNWWIGVDNDGLKKQPLTQKIRKSKTNEYNVYGKPMGKLEDQIQSIPSDIKRVASATTLRVLHSGDTEYKFKLTTMVLRWIGKMAAKSFTKTMTRNLLGTDKKPETMSIPNVSQMKLEKESVGKSKILKGGYKKTTRHRRLPVIPIVTRNPFTESVSVFGSLPYCELNPVPTISMPETMKEILQRNAAMQQAKDAEKAKLKGAGMRRTSHVATGSRHSRRGTSSLSKRRESFSPKTSPGPSRGSSATPEINVAPNSSKGSAKRLSNRIEEVLEKTSSALKMTKLPPINQKNGDTRMDAAKNKVVKKLKANRDTYEFGT